eukprot:PhF_6_TR3488/c0_g1_i1/m.5121
MTSSVINRSCSPEGYHYFEHNTVKDWSHVGPSSSAEGTFPKAPRNTGGGFQDSDVSVGTLFAGDGIGDMKQVVHVKPPRVIFGSEERFPAYHGVKQPLALEALPTMVKPTCSKKGTFLTNKDRGNFFEGRTVTPGPQYNGKESIFESSMHRNIANFKSKAPRFAPLVDPEDAPGPIYYPPSDFGRKSRTIPGDSRFHYERDIKAVPGPGAYSPFERIKHIKRSQTNTPTTCTFGHRALEQNEGGVSSTPGPGHYRVPSTATKSASVSFSPTPFTSDASSVKVSKKSSLSHAGSSNGVSPALQSKALMGSNSALQGSVTTMPHGKFSTMPRFQPPPQTPGPGDYNVGKYRPKNKPGTATFSREAHDKTFIRMIPCRDSPGPCEYVGDKMPAHTNHNKPMPGVGDRWR